MDERLLEIIGDEAFWVNCIDKQMLVEYTDRYPIDDLDKMNAIKWENVRHLYIMSRLRVKHNWVFVDEGAYVSEDHTWVLLVGVDEVVEKMAIKSCIKNLTLLNISTEDPISVDLSGGNSLCNLKIYNQSANVFSISYVHGVECHDRLEVLLLINVVFGRSLYLSGMRELKKLHIGMDELDSYRTLIFGIGSLGRLERLVLQNVSVGDDIDLSQYPNLKTLSLSDGQADLDSRCRVHGLSGLTKLRHLCLRGAHVAMLDKLPHSIHLKSLVVSKGQELTKLEGLERFPNMERLDIAATGIKRLPEELRSLKKLRLLDLSGLELEELPYWLPELKLPITTKYASEGILLDHTTVKDVDMTIFEQSQDMILQWFEEQKKGNQVLLNEIKVVFLGDGEVGKSHTIARLLKDGGEPDKSFTGSSTPGIAIEDKKYDINGQKVQVHFWDFGGQDILYSMHRMFMTKRTVYVILVDARSESKGNQARDWLDTVKSFAGDAPVLLVVNKTDENPAASIDEESLRRKYSNLKKVVYMSALEATQDEFNTIFTEAMLELICQSGSLEIKWPKQWTQVKDGLQNMQTPYIFSDAYEKLCRDCDVHENQINLLEWFNDLGVSFCQCRDYNLRDYVILRPDWMTNAIYTILFNKRKEVDNGLISLEEISDLLNPSAENRGKVKQVMPDKKYNWQEINYVLDVVRKFRLSYSVNKNVEFFPMLCKENSKPVAQEYADDKNTLEFQMMFEYLPNNVLHRLTVGRWPELDKDNIWLTGARFVQPNTGLSAVVRIDGNVLQIYVRSENALHAPNTYLSVIEGSIDQIRKELNLPKPKNRLVYKVGERRAEFDYERLLKMFAKGKVLEYSDELDRDFPIRDILNQFAPAESTEQEQLLADMVKACSQLQADTLYWGTKENSRNTYIRNALNNMPYIVRDQTLYGISGAENAEGELDLDIRKYKDIPWTICEALRINSGTKTDWNYHLKKLLDNYNPNGVRFLILLTYVDDGKDKFDHIWASFKDHIQGHNPGEFSFVKGSFKHYQTERWTGNHYIQTAKCKYVLGDYAPTVYHIFVRMGR